MDWAETGLYFSATPSECRIVKDGTHAFVQRRKLQASATYWRQFPQTEEVIKSFAKKFNTHPAIITGRLQIKKAIPYSRGRTFLQSVIFD